MNCFYTTLSESIFKKKVRENGYETDEYKINLNIIRRHALLNWTASKIHFIRNNATNALVNEGAD